MAGVAPGNAEETMQLQKKEILDRVLQDLQTLLVHMKSEENEFRDKHDRTFVEASINDQYQIEQILNMVQDVMYEFN